MEITRGHINKLLQRKSDISHRDKTLSIVTKYFMTTMNATGIPSSEELAKLKVFAKEICVIVIDERPVIAKASAEGGRRQVDLDPDSVAGALPTKMVALGALAESDPDEAANHLTATADRIVGITIANDLIDGVEPTSIAIASRPPPKKCDDFQDLFTEAICYRVAGIVCFFLRDNPAVVRELPRPFLLSSAFADRLSLVLRGLIVPKMVAGSRNIAMLEHSQAWAGKNTAEFWGIVERNDQYKTSIAAAWNAAWGEFRQRREMRDGTPVLVASPALLELRKRLAPIADEFTVPPIRNTEIDLFVSLLFEYDLAKVERNWQKLRQLYEQEMDRRDYQDKARSGALRDSILEAFDALPDSTGDFLALLCYFCFPHVDLYFLDRFTHNKGSTVAERKRRVPYLMQFLADERVPHVLLRESHERQDREHPSQRQ